jgi:hypothetical protein
VRVRVRESGCVIDNIRLFYSSAADARLGLLVLGKTDVVVVVVVVVVTVTVAGTLSAIKNLAW